MKILFKYQQRSLFFGIAKASHHHNTTMRFFTRCKKHNIIHIYTQTTYYSSNNDI